MCLGVISENRFSQAHRESEILSDTGRMVISVDEKVASARGVLMADLQRWGKPLPAGDGLFPDKSAREARSILTIEARQAMFHYDAIDDSDRG